MVDAVIASLNLTENMNLALDYRMSGMSYPDIVKNDVAGDKHGL